MTWQSAICEVFQFLAPGYDHAVLAVRLHFCVSPFHIDECLALSHEQAQLLCSSPNGPAILGWLNEEGCCRLHLRSSSVRGALFCCAYWPPETPG